MVGILGGGWERVGWRTIVDVESVVDIMRTLIWGSVVSVR